MIFFFATNKHLLVQHTTPIPLYLLLFMAISLNAFLKVRLELTQLFTFKCESFQIAGFSFEYGESFTTKYSSLSKYIRNIDTLSILIS